MTQPTRRRRSSDGSAARKTAVAVHAPYGDIASERPISGFAVLPLRLFLGVTFVYAALQKVMDPGFFHAGSPTYIGSQILAFSRGSPIQAVLHHLMHVAVAIGWLTVVTEGTIGTLVLLGLLTRPAALVGMTLSTGFFLSASWNTYPYFFGSDIVFVVCWLTIAITGPGIFSLDAVAERPLMTALSARIGPDTPMARRLVPLLTGWRGSTAPSEDSRAPEVTGAGFPAGRSRAISRGEALAGSLATVGLIALGLPPRRGSNAPTGQLAGSGQAAPTAAPAHPGSTAAGTTTPANASIPPGAKKIGNVSQLPANFAGTVSDPKTGDPAIIVHTSGSHYYAYDAVCTHAGCTVQYDSQQHLLVCPCHGGTFDPAHGAQVVAGPPPSPLTALEMKIDAHGDIYIV